MNLKSFLLNTNSSNRALKATWAAMVAMSLATAAHGQSYADGSGYLAYSFSLDSSSYGMGNYLTVTQSNYGASYNGLVVYNDYNGNLSAYNWSSGSGSANTLINPGSAYNGYYGGYWSGQGGSSSDADVLGTNGAAISSVGISNFLVFFNSSQTDSIVIDFSALAFDNGSVSITGAPSATNYANTTDYVGLYDFDISGGYAVANPLILVQDSAGGSSTTTYTSDWTPIVFNGSQAYAGFYEMTLAPGTSHGFEFYTSQLSESSANTGASTPGPEAAIPMGIGILGILRRRRSAAK